MDLGVTAVHLELLHTSCLLELADIEGLHNDYLNDINKLTTIITKMKDNHSNIYSFRFNIEGIYDVLLDLRSGNGRIN